MAIKIQLRRDTAANWTSNNPTLDSGELGVETDTGLFKIGDNSTAWTSLDYANPSATIGSDPTGITGADQVTNVVSLTQAEYDAIVTPDAATLYVITD